MALPTVTISQFIGEIEVVLNDYQGNRFQAYIDQHYADFVAQVIGAGALAEIEAQSPLRQKWLDLFDGVSYYNTEAQETMRHKGLTFAVLRHIYFMYERDNFIPTTVGNTQSAQETSTRVMQAYNSQQVQVVRNRGIQEVNYPICLFLENYENFQGTISGFVDNGGGSYTINTASTIYLADGDTIAIGGTEYVISNLVADTSFDITAPLGSSFAGVYVYSPYEVVKFKVQGYGIG